MTATVPATSAAPEAEAEGAPEATRGPAGASRDTPASQARQRAAAVVDRAYVPLLVVAIAVGVAVRFASRGQLWLDEALTVDIARLPPHQLLQALKVDGSPPLYYVLLHVWMDVVGRGATAVRAFSGALSTLALVPMWLLGRRVERLTGARPAGRPLALAAVALFACAPFALRFGSETRMYSLVLLETCLGGLALLRALEDPRPGVRRLAPVTLAVLALALTHYWSFFLLAAVGIGLLAARRWRILAAFVAAAVLFSPQLPTLAFQLAHTGTPWAPPTQPRAVLDTLLTWGGPGTELFAAPLGAALIVVAAIGAFTRHDEAPGGAQSWLVDLRRNRTGLALFGLSVGPLVIAVALTMVAGAGFVERYTAIAVPAYVLVVAVGASRFRSLTATVLVGALTVVGLVTGTADALNVRTEAAQIATAINASTARGDLVVYCPDQLGPAVHRLVSPGRTEVSYGDDLGPARVDWVDYVAHNAALDPVALARDYSALAGPGHAVALVWADGYRTFGGQCGALADQLSQLRPGSAVLVGRDPGQGESATLTLFPGPAGLPATSLGNPSATSNG